MHLCRGHVQWRSTHSLWYETTLLKSNDTVKSNNMDIGALKSTVL